MINIQSAKPIELLKKFDQEELKQFEKFLTSGFIANSPLMESMFKWLIKYYPTFDHTKFTISHFSKKIFPKDQTLKEQKLRKKLSEFSKLLMTFIAIQELKNDDLLQEQLQANFLLRKSDYHGFFKLRQNSLRRIEEHLIRDSNYHLEKSKITEQLYINSVKNNVKPDINYLYQTSDYLDRFYYLKKLEHYCSKNSVTQVFKNEEKNTIESINLNQLKSQFGDDPVFKLYFQLIALRSSSTNTILFNSIFKYLKTHLKTFSEFQQKFIFFQLLNYSIKQVKHKKSIYLKKQSELYTFGLEQNIFIEGHYIPDVTFLNISFSAVLNKDFKLVDQLINKYGYQLPPNEHQRAITLAKSFAEFHQGNYQKAYDLIMHSGESELHYQLRTRLLSIRCLYHMNLKADDYLKTLNSQIKNFDNYILREKSLNKTSRASYANFNKVLRKILNFNKKTMSEKDKESLIQKINNYQVIIAKDWLLEIINTVR